jgi:hypothetical protein
MRLQRTGSSPSALRSPLTRGPLGGATSRRWLGGIVLFAIAAVGCTSASPRASTKPVAVRSRSSFGQNLSLDVSLGSALAARDKAVTAKFALTNNGTAVFEGCFGQSWGVSVLVAGHDAGHLVSVDHPNCDERVTLLPRQTILWSKTVPLNDLRAGTAKVTAWVKVIDPATCDPRSGCHEVSVATPSMTIAVGAR